jgi:hypothetical protein
MLLSLEKYFVKAAVIGAALVASSVAGAGTLNIVGCDSFEISNGTITCVTSTTPPSPTAPSGCSATATPSAFPTATGGAVQLSASCTGGAAVASQTWTRTRSGAVTQVSAPYVVPDNSSASSSAVYTYTARLCAADGTSCTSATTGTVTVPAGIAPPPAPPSTCGNLSVVTPFLEGNSSLTEMSFSGQRFLTQDFNGSAVVVGTIKVPSGASGASRLQVYEYVDTKTDRRVWLSKSRCDMSQSSGAAYAFGKTPTVYIRVGGTPTASEVLMQPGETWYVMIKNEMSFWGQVSPSCSTTAGAHCNVGITLHTIQ